VAIQKATGGRHAADFDRRNADWYIDKLVQLLVFIGGISAIIFVVTGTPPRRRIRNMASWH